MPSVTHPLIRHRAHLSHCVADFRFQWSTSNTCTLYIVHYTHTRALPLRDRKFLIEFRSPNNRNCRLSSFVNRRKNDNNVVKANVNEQEMMRGWGLHFSTLQFDRMLYWIELGGSNTFNMPKIEKKTLLLLIIWIIRLCYKALILILKENTYFLRTMTFWMCQEICRKKMYLFYLVVSYAIILYNKFV